MKISPPNYTQTPNELFDHWLPNLGEGELKVLLVIMRKTFGWHKEKDAISISQLSKITGLHEETVVKAAKSLQSKGIVNREVIGQEGKQQTIYSLVIQEVSNNSYPSVKPSRPLGSDGPVQTEAQKKPFSYKETTSKESDAAVFFEELKDLDIPIADKVEISRRFEENTVRNAIAWATHPETKLNKGLSPAIKWACQNQPEVPKAKIDVEVSNKAYAMRYDGLKSSTAKCEVLNKYIEISNCGVNVSFVLGYDEKGFIDQFNNALIKNGFNIIS